MKFSQKNRHLTCSKSYHGVIVIWPGQTRFSWTLILFEMQNNSSNIEKSGSIKRIVHKEEKKRNIFLFLRILVLLKSKITCSSRYQGTLPGGHWVRITRYLPFQRKHLAFHYLLWSSKQKTIRKWEKRGTTVSSHSQQTKL